MPRPALLLGLLAVSMSSCIENRLLPDDPPVVDAEGVLEVSPRILQFGAPASGWQVDRTVTLSNVGAAELWIGAFELPDGAGFEVVGTSPVGALAADASIEVTVRYTADGADQVRQALVRSDDLRDPVLAIDLVVDEATGVLVVQPDPVDFGATGIGVPVTRTVTLSNAGDGAFEVFDLDADGPYTVVEAPVLPWTLRPTEPIEVVLGFTPTTSQPRHPGLLWVDSNARISPSPVELTGAADLGDVRGRICDPSGDDWVAGAFVYAEIDTDRDGIVDDQVEDFTDGDGTYELHDLPDGTWTVHVQKGSFSTSFPVTLAGGASLEIVEPECLQSDLKIGVVPGTYDDIGALLGSIGLDYDLIDPDVLADAAALADYDLVFVACAAITEPRSVDDDGIAEWIAAGGSLYASDLTLLALSSVFPDEYTASSGGLYRSATLEVLDAAMRARIGASTLTVNYESGITPLLPDGDGAVTSEVLLRLSGTSEPATVRMTHGSGTAIFTAFHTSNTATSSMTKLFKEMVLSL